MKEQLYMKELCKDIETLGRNLMLLKETKNMTYEQFSNLIHYDRNNLSSLRYGYPDIKLNTVARIAKRLNIDIGTLFSRSFIDDKEYYLDAYPYVEVAHIAIFREHVKDLLERRQMKQIEICDENHESVSRILCGHVNNPRISSLSSIAAKLNVNLSELLSQNTKKE